MNGKIWGLGLHPLLGAIVTFPEKLQKFCELIKICSTDQSNLDGTVKIKLLQHRKYIEQEKLLGVPSNTRTVDDDYYYSDLVGDEVYFTGTNENHEISTYEAPNNIYILRYKKDKQIVDAISIRPKRLSNCGLDVTKIPDFKNIFSPDDPKLCLNSTSLNEYFRTMEGSFSSPWSLPLYSSYCWGLIDPGGAGSGTGSIYISCTLGDRNRIPLLTVSFEYDELGEFQHGSDYYEFDQNYSTSKEGTLTGFLDRAGSVVPDYITWVSEDID